HVGDGIYVVLTADDPILVADERQSRTAQGALDVREDIAAFPPIDGEYHQLVTGRGPLQSIEHAHFLSAGRAPGSPEGNDDDLSAVVAELGRPSEPLRWDVAHLQFLVSVSGGRGKHAYHEQERHCASETRQMPGCHGPPRGNGAGNRI